MGHTCRCVEKINETLSLGSLITQSELFWRPADSSESGPPNEAALLIFRLGGRSE